MDGATFSRLLDRSNALILKVNADLDLRQAHFSAKASSSENGSTARPLTKDLKERIEQHYGHRIRLINATSVTPQIEEYGVKNFERDFIRMQSIKVEREPTSEQTVDVAPRQRSIQKINDEKKHAREDALLKQRVWRALPNSPFKRFQEAFCEPRNYIVPHYTVNARGDVKFAENSDELCRSVKACLVSPQLIPESLVESLGLAKFTKEEKSSSIAQLFRLSQPDIIQGLKSRWDNSKPLSNSDFRVQVVIRPTEAEAHKDAELYPLAKPFPNGVHGGLLFSSEAINLSTDSPYAGISSIGNIQPLNAVQRRVSFFKSVYGAHRKTSHQRAGYELETEELSYLIAILKRTAEQINTEWRRSSSNSEKANLLRMLSKTANQALDILDADIDRNKVDAAERLELSRNMRDSLNRLNAKSTVAHIQKAIESLTQRQTKIASKGSYNSRDSALLLGELSEQAHIITQSVSAIESLGYRSRNGTDPAPLLRVLKTNEELLSQVTVKPLSTYAGAIRVYGSAARNAITRARSARPATDGILMMGGLFKIAECLERMKGYSISEEAIPFAKLSLQERIFISALPSSTLITSEKGKQVLRNLRALHSAIRDHLGLFADVMGSEIEQRRWCGQFRALIRSVDIEELTRSLIPDSK